MSSLNPIAKIDLQFNVTGDTIERDGLQFLTIKKIDVDPKVGDAKFYASGLAADPNLSML